MSQTARDNSSDDRRTTLQAPELYQWIAHDASLEDARAYRAYLVADHRCSFCNRTMYDVDSLVEGNGGARICNLCVTSFHEEMAANPTRD